MVKTKAGLPQDEPFCQYLVHLFSQLSALATMALHVNKAGLAASDSGVNVDLLRERSNGDDGEADRSGESHHAETRKSGHNRKSVEDLRHLTSRKEHRKRSAPREQNNLPTPRPAVGPARQPSLPTRLERMFGP